MRGICYHYCLTYIYFYIDSRELLCVICGGLQARVACSVLLAEHGSILCGTPLKSLLDCVEGLARKNAMAWRVPESRRFYHSAPLLLTLIVPRKILNCEFIISF